MRDQADRLREIINNMKTQQENSSSLVESTLNQKKCRVLTVTSGKGGVGKTTFSVNLALSLGKMGYRVVILDADLGLANIDVLFGITPSYTLLDVIKNNKTIYDVLTEGPMNVKFVSGGCGIREMANLKKEQLEAIIENISSLDKIADIVLIDTGAGISENVIQFVLAADEIILITTPEPTSIMDAYALVKTVSYSDKNKIIQLVINRARSEKEALNVTMKLSNAVETFLNIKPHDLGYIMYDSNIEKAIKSQEPFIISHPRTLVSRQFNEIAHKIMQVNQDSSKSSYGLRGFLQRLININNA